jgi:hypothetical protein
MVATLCDYLVVKSDGEVFDYVPLSTMKQNTTSKPFFKLSIPHVDLSAPGGWLTVMNASKMVANSWSQLDGIIINLEQYHDEYLYDVKKADKSGDTLRWGPAEKSLPSSTQRIVGTYGRYTISGSGTLSLRPAPANSWEPKLNQPDYAILSPTQLWGSGPKPELESPDASWLATLADVDLVRCSLPPNVDVSRLPVVRTLGDLDKWRRAATVKDVVPLSPSGFPSANRKLRIQVPVYPYLAEETVAGQLVRSIRLAMDAERVALKGEGHDIRGKRGAGPALEQVFVGFQGYTSEFLHLALTGNFSDIYQLDQVENVDLVQQDQAAAANALFVKYRAAVIKTFFPSSQVPDTWGATLPSRYTTGGAERVPLGFYTHLASDLEIQQAELPALWGSRVGPMGYMVRYPAASNRETCVVFFPFAIRKLLSKRAELPNMPLVAMVTHNSANEGIACHI